MTLARSSIEPFLTFSSRRDLRRAAHQAWTARGTHAGPADNTPLIREIMALRAEQARLLGYDNFAAYRLDDSMAKTDAAVERLLLQVWEPAKNKARGERAALEEIARAEGLNEPIEPWDWRYYAEQVRRARYDLDEAEVKPYFALDNMVEAAFDTAGRLFGLSFTARPELKAYHPDVRVWEVRDREGAMSGFSCTTISRGPASARGRGRAATAISRPSTDQSRRSSSTTTISPDRMPRAAPRRC